MVGSAPLLGGDKIHYLMVDGMRRPITNAHTWEHLQFMGAFGDSDAIHAVPDCALEAIPMGIPINYMEEDE